MTPLGLGAFAVMCLGLVTIYLLLKPRERMVAVKPDIIIAPRPITLITEDTPTEVAIAILYANQRTKERAFFADLERLILDHEKRGLDPSRIVRDLETVAKALHKVSTTGGKL